MTETKQTLVPFKFREWEDYKGVPKDIRPRDVISQHTFTKYSQCMGRPEAITTTGGQSAWRQHILWVPIYKEHPHDFEAKVATFELSPETGARLDWNSITLALAADALEHLVSVELRVGGNTLAHLLTADLLSLPNAATGTDQQVVAIRFFQGNDVVVPWLAAYHRMELSLYFDSKVSATQASSSDKWEAHIAQVPWTDVQQLETNLQQLEDVLDGKQVNFPVSVRFDPIPKRMLGFKSGLVGFFPCDSTPDHPGTHLWLPKRLESFGGHRTSVDGGSTWGPVLDSQGNEVTLVN